MSIPGASNNSMNVVDLPLNKLFVSVLNVRKDLNNVDDETNIADLAQDIKTNGLLNPLTVRKVNGGRYEIIAGQRRYLAMKSIQKEIIPCNLIDVDDQKAEELSLIENTQRNQLSSGDKVRLYGRLFDIYGNIEKVASSIHQSSQTIRKYLSIRNLPTDIMNRLDNKGSEHLTIDTAVALAKLPSGINHSEVIQAFSNLSSKNKTEAIKNIDLEEYKNDPEEYLKNVADDVALKNVAEENMIKNLNLQLIGPFVIDRSNGRKVKIPDNLSGEIIDLIRRRNDVIEYYE